MSAKKTTVTHADGTVSTRKSKTMVYTHAVVVGPPNADAYAAKLERDADDLDARAATYREAVAAGRVTLASRGDWVTGNPMVTHVATLAGTNVNTWTSADGMTEDYRSDGCVPARGYLLANATESANDFTERAAELRKRAAEIRVAGEVVGEAWGVLRWSTRADLAHRAANGEFAHYAASGYVIRVVEVDPS